VFDRVQSIASASATAATSWQRPPSADSRG
jgi:hypothetical protein